MASGRVNLMSAVSANQVQVHPLSSSFKDSQGNAEKLSNVSLPKSLTVKNQKLTPPLVYILNHEKFNGVDRNGSAKDVTALKKTFKGLKCPVVTVPNPTKDDVTETINKLEKIDFFNRSALVLIILSHGGENERILACDNQLYHLDRDVLDPIRRIKSLQGKPKILIVQACKGRLTADAKPEDYGHYIKCYSTSEGFVAYLGQTYGSFYIQTLCKVMDKDARTKDFREIIKDVNEKTEEESRRLGLRQVPSTDGMLEQPFCFGDFMNLK